MAATSTLRARSRLQQTRLFLLVALLASAALATDVPEEVSGGGDGTARAPEVGVEESTAASEGKGKRQALYGGPLTSLLPSAYQLPAATSGGSAGALVSSGSQKATAYQPLAGLGLPLGYGSATSAAYSAPLLRSGGYPGLLSAASAPLSNYSSAGSPLAALLSAGYLAAPSSAQHNYTLPVAANLLAQGSSYFPGGGFYASAPPSAANFPHNFTFGQPAASSLFAQNSAAYPSFYPAPSGFRQNFNAGLFGAASTSSAFPGGVFAQGGASPGSAGGPFTFFSYPVAAKSGQQSVATVGVSNQLLAPHQPLSLEQAKQRFPQYFAGVEEPYTRFQQQLRQQQQQHQQLQQQKQQPHQPQSPLQVPQHHGPAEPPKPAQVTEHPEEHSGSRYARPHPAPATSDTNDDDDDDGSYDERPAYQSHRHHAGAGVDHHKIRAEQESEDEESGDRHPNSYQRIVYHGKPYHGEDESGKPSHPGYGYHPKAGLHRNHRYQEDSGRPQEASEEEEEEDHHRPAYSSSHPSGRPQPPASRYHQSEDESEDLLGGRPRPPVTSAFLRSYSRPLYRGPRPLPGPEEQQEEAAGSDRYSSLRFPSAELDSHFNRAAAASLSSSPSGPRPAAQTLHTYRFKVPDYATETYSPVTGRPSRMKSSPQRRPYQGHAEDEEDAEDEDSEGRYSSPALRVHKMAWSYSRSHSSTR